MLIGYNHQGKIVMHVDAQGMKVGPAFSPGYMGKDEQAERLAHITEEGMMEGVFFQFPSLDDFIIPGTRIPKFGGFMAGIQQEYAGAPHRELPATPASATSDSTNHRLNFAN